jgi:hypothetical protein
MGMYEQLTTMLRAGLAGAAGPGETVVFKPDARPSRETQAVVEILSAGEGQFPDGRQIVERGLATLITPDVGEVTTRDRLQVVRNGQNLDFSILAIRDKNPAFTVVEIGRAERDKLVGPNQEADRFPGRTGK